eukprot:jgi/Orpsp1_1/1184424/evm.model.c7180000089453.1
MEEREKALKSRIRQERLERERERERVGHERMVHELIESERIPNSDENEVREREVKESEERERVVRESLEREAKEREVVERLERERRERERIEEMEREKKLKLALQQERLERERNEREQREREERERVEREQREKEKKEKELKENKGKKRKEKELKEKKEKEERERVEREERERIERERKKEREEFERIKKEKREKVEKAIKERIEQIEREVKERVEKEVKERIEKEEKERLEKEEVEREEKGQELIEDLMFERERIEKEREELVKERVKMEKEKEDMKKERYEIGREKENIVKEKLKIERMKREIIEMKIEMKMEMENSKFKDKTPSIKTPTLVMALHDFSGEKYDQLDISKDEFLVVTDWNCKEEGWVYGHRKDNKEEKGLFPKVFVKVYDNENNKGIMIKSNITPDYRIKFENKVKLLRSLMEMQVVNDSTIIFVHRNNLFHDAFNSIMSKSPEELKKQLRVEYIGEEGLDAGGLLRDFFYQLSKEIGNVNYSLFQYVHDNSYELEINPNSGMVDSDHLEYFRFIGRIIGLAIFHRQYLSIFFTLLFYKKLLNKPLEFSDLKYVDYEMFKNLKQLKENDGAKDLYLTFQMEIKDCFGHHKTIELKPDGANIDVTDSNKYEYIDLITKNKLSHQNDSEQLEALQQGFYEIIPDNINILIDEIDLKFLISGVNEVDVNDWENNTIYDGYEKDDITIINFWKCVRNFSHENRTKLLLFATGNSQVPVTGFKDLQGSGKIQPFKIKKHGLSKDLPKSHTWYSTK